MRRVLTMTPEEKSVHGRFLCRTEIAVARVEGPLTFGGNKAALQLWIRAAKE